MNDQNTFGMIFDPWPTLTNNTRGYVSLQVVHNSWDGREILENALSQVDNPASFN